MTTGSSSDNKVMSDVANDDSAQSLTRNEISGRPLGSSDGDISQPSRSHSQQQVHALLLDYSTADSWINRQLGAQLVGQFGYEDLASTLAILLGDKNEWVRYHALSSLIAISAFTEDVSRRVSHSKSDPFFRVRVKAMEYLRGYEQFLATAQQRLFQATELKKAQ